MEVGRITWTNEQKIRLRSVCLECPCLEKDVLCFEDLPLGLQQLIAVPLQLFLQLLFVKQNYLKLFCFVYVLLVQT